VEALKKHRWSAYLAPKIYPLSFKNAKKCIDRHLIPRATFERSARPLLLPAPVPHAQVHSSPWLEEKWDFDSQALITNIRDPFLHDQYQTRRRESNILEPNFAI